MSNTPTSQVSTDLPRHLADKGFRVVAPGIARRPRRNDVGHAGGRWEWLVRIASGWTQASSEAHARSLRDLAHTEPITRHHPQCLEEGGKSCWDFGCEA